MTPKQPVAIENGQEEGLEIAAEVAANILVYGCAEMGLVRLRIQRDDNGGGLGAYLLEGSEICLVSRADDVNDNTLRCPDARYGLRSARITLGLKIPSARGTFLTSLASRCALSKHILRARDPKLELVSLLTSLYRSR